MLYGVDKSCAFAIIHAGRYLHMTTRKNVFLGIIILLAGFGLTGCNDQAANKNNPSKVNTASVATTSIATTPTLGSCKLNFDVKSITIKGDSDHYMERALRTRLYELGVKPSEKGVEIVGDLVGVAGWPPDRLSVEVPSLAFSASATATERLNNRTEAINESVQEIASKAALEFCTSAAASK
jgi:hypothetical protein